MLLAYLDYNFSNTKKIFMGDTGSLIIGFCIGFCALKYLAMDVSNFSYFTIQPQNELLVLAAIIWIPLFDLLRVIAIRLYHRKSPFYPDRNHSHHILIDGGLSHFEAAMLMGFLNYALVIITIWLSAYLNYMELIAVLLSLFTTGVFILYMIKKKTLLKNKQKQDLIN
jgi:UDP-N-acetylmuramyl pentapeptide phosphotransferase/UDP-N-acetylglucosamine-1-phosphate transferase